MSDLPLLSLVIWIPIIGGLAVLAIQKSAGDNMVRWASLAVSVLTFLISLPLFFAFDNSTHQMQFTEHASWIPAFNINCI